MAKIIIELESILTKEDCIELAKRQPTQAAKALKPEIDVFERYMECVGPLMSVEKSIILEFLGAKITGKI
jgi:hypothetical protein